MKNPVLVFSLFGGLIISGLVAYLLLFNKKSTIIPIGTTPKTPSVDFSTGIWTPTKITGVYNPDKEDHEDDLFFVNNLCSVCRVSVADFYDMNPNINPQIKYFPYGYIVNLPTSANA